MDYIAFWLKVHCIVNSLYRSPQVLRKIMTQVGVDTLDGVDLHGKWPRGGEVPHGDAMTFEHYMNEVPLVDHKIGVTW
eukprot:COSAG02_NODE_18576_length_931_cov_1.456731_1_plen_77_part_10